MTLRVLHCPADVGGNAAMLARAERELGLASRAIVFEQSPFGYRSDEVLLKPGDGRLTREIRRLGLLRRALRDFDVVHFNYGMSIAPMALRGGPLAQAISRVVELRDLPLLKRAGKAIFVSYQGDDARQGKFCREHFAITFATEVDAEYYRDDELKARRIAVFSRYADRIFVGSPDLMYFFPETARYLPVAPVDLSEWPLLPSRELPAEPLVVHAPSHRQVKGTRFIIDAVERLRAEGVRFRFQLVEKMTRDEARRLYDEADLLVDQLLAGWYGGLAIELMALGKPVVCYIREEDLRFVPQSIRETLPVINATPSSIYDVLKEWLTTRRGELRARGLRGRAFVEEVHDPRQVARELKREYEAAIARRRSG